MAGNKHVDIAIIGAGMSGLCMASKLLAAGIDTFTVFEQADEVGGTWRDNTYPGLHCDVPSRYYMYSFAPNPDWSHLLSPGPEIQDYFRTTADERGLRRHVRFGTEVTAATHRDGKWWISTPGGEEAFDVVITATGVLRVPRLPDIPGRDSFAGPAFHTSRWDHDIPLSDKRIGMIGTGSTGVQIIAALGGEVKGLSVFQRTAQWVFPWPNHRYSAVTRQLLRRWPALNKLGYDFWGFVFRGVLSRAVIRPCWQRRLVETLCSANLRLWVRDPQLRAKLTPNYRAMCKRLIFAGHYYRSVQRPGVEVITEPIARIEPDAVVTTGGARHEVDVLVFATGFDAHAFVRPMRIVGPGGVTIEETWIDGPHAYKSVALPGFPNLFMLMGPHAPVGTNSLVAIAENQADYIMWWINQMRCGAVVSAEPTEVATKLYNESMKAAMGSTMWVTGCSSWYLGKDGLPELFPWVPERYTELMRRPDVNDYQVR
ncbi:MAG TPA: NAD(P)/FAD-dependent oxidoreductase [Mycobacterium sp.]|nr:NAD(P)/FAD-dependent oxidoreductase [Mycobacterium sp.]